MSRNPPLSRSSGEGRDVREETVMEGTRRVICPVCGHTNDFGKDCLICGNPVALDEGDHQNVVFVGMDDGYHSHYAPPTSYHERYRCASYGPACETCIHAPSSDIFCHFGKVDIRRRRRVLDDGTVVCVYNGWVERV